MKIPQKSKSSSFYRRRFSLLLFAALTVLIWKYLPAPPKFENDTRHNRPTPNYNVGDKPQFLHRSRFREEPDHEYEAKVDNMLLSIETGVRSAGEMDDGGIGTIWQISLTGNEKHERDSDSIDFEQENKDWKYRLVNSSWATQFINNEFKDIPDVQKTFASYPSNVLRADFLRYLLLWYYGGYYADMDIYPARPIKSCPSLNPLFSPSPSQEDHPNISLVLGIEIDEPYASPKLKHDWHWSRSYGFIQYTMYAPQRFSPLLRRTIVRVLAHTKQHHERTNFFLRPRYKEDTTLEITGPGVFTDAILDVLSESLPPTHPLIISSIEHDRGVGELVAGGKPQKRVTWAPFHRLKNPLWVDSNSSLRADGDVSGKRHDMGGLGVLPINVWGNGQRHSGAGHFGHAQACVNHRFGRTWKKGWWEYLFG